MRVFKFLKDIYPFDTGYIELRFIKKSKVLVHWIPLPLTYEKWKLWETVIMYRNSEKWNIYFSVCPRDRKSGKKIDVSRTNVLWADIDYKDFKDERELRNRLSNFCEKFPPTYEITSGNGRHLYWILSFPYTTKKWGPFETMLRSMYSLMNADSVGDVSRVMRLPGTHNHKYGHSFVLPFCEIVKSSDSIRLDYKELYDWIKPQMKIPFKKFKVTKAPPEGFNQKFLRLLQDDQKIKETWLGRRLDLNDTSRSAYDMSMASLLVKNGFSDDAIIDILREMPSGKSSDATTYYLEFTIKKARRS